MHHLATVAAGGGNSMKMINFLWEASIVESPGDFRGSRGGKWTDVLR